MRATFFTFSLSLALMLSSLLPQWAQALSADLPTELNAKELENWDKVRAFGLAKLESGKFKSAEKYLNIARTLAQKDNQNQDKYLNTLSDLGALNEARGRYWHARHNYDEVFNMIDKNYFAPNNIKLANALYNLGKINYLLADLPKAKENLSQAKDLFARLSPHSINEARTLNVLSEVDLAYTKIETATEEAQKALQISTDLSGPKSLTTCESLNCLAKCALANSEPKLAEKFLSQAMLIIAANDSRSAILSRADCLYNCAEVYLSEGRLNQALVVAEESLAIRQQLCGSNHPVTAESLSILALIYIAQKDFASAQAILEQCFEIISDQFGMESLQAAKLRQIQGICALAQGNKEEAKVYFNKSVATVTKFAFTNNPELKRILNLNSTYDQVSGSVLESLKHRVQEIFATKSFGNPLDPAGRRLSSLLTTGAIRPITEKEPPKAPANGSKFKAEAKSLWAAAIVVIPFVLIISFSVIKNFFRIIRRTSEEETESAPTKSKTVFRPRHIVDNPTPTAPPAPKPLLSRFNAPTPHNKVNKFWDINQ